MEKPSRFSVVCRSWKSETRNQKSEIRFNTLISDFWFLIFRQSFGDRALHLICWVDYHALPEIRRCDLAVIPQVHERTARLGCLVLDGLQKVIYCVAWEVGVAFAYHRERVCV